VEKTTRFGLWDSYYAGSPPRGVYGDPSTVQRAAEFFNTADIQTVEDWGCGLGGLSAFLAPHQHYVGVDGSRSPYANMIVDLEGYRSDVDAVHLRHVLEHNFAWENILRNALASYRCRMVLTLFTPWSACTRAIAEYPNFLGTGATMIDLSFCRDEVIAIFQEENWSSQENIQTRTQYGIEHMFFFIKPLAASPK
jgi:hypothetical protein